jgi:alanine racemase
VSRGAWAEVSAAAITHNVSTLCSVGGPVWAVVKADGYGHGAVLAARAALAGGATGLCVALAQEGVALREAGLDARILVLSEQPEEEMASAVAHDLELTVYSQRALDMIARTGAVSHPVHLKIDTGMHRVGAEPADALALAVAIERSPHTRLEGVFTHLATADEPSNKAAGHQIDTFDGILADLQSAGIEPPLVHIANSAAGMALPRSRRSFMRAGIAIYGVIPGPGVHGHVHALGLRPALSLKAQVSHVQKRRAGDHFSYGLRGVLTHDATVATLPIGYADGVPRRIASVGLTVLLGGQRRSVLGVVTMDQMMIDCGDDDVRHGDEVVLIGHQGSTLLPADEWAQRLDTIPYEILCGISSRIERRPV